MGRYNLDGYVPSVFVSFSKGVHVDSPDVSAVFTPFLGLQRAASFRRYLSATRLAVGVVGHLEKLADMYMCSIPTRRRERLIPALHDPLAPAARTLPHRTTTRPFTELRR